LTIKAAYVIGIIYCICESVSILLSKPEKLKFTYIPAYGEFASGVELLGRCLRGNHKTYGNSKDLEAGFKNGWRREKPRDAMIRGKPAFGDDVLNNNIKTKNHPHTL
jgi:hypothetical protein